MLECLKERCEIVHEDMGAMTKDEFTMARRVGLGASDASVVLGINKFGKSVSDLIANKISLVVTEDERRIGTLPNVKKGSDLEPLILSKYTETTGQVIFKPTEMYRLKDFPYITINYDGLTPEGCPVEAKLVTIYGDKYYNFDLATNAIEGHTQIPPKVQLPETDIKANCKAAEIAYGIPDYYYVQVQQQLLGTGAVYGQLAALRDKDWKLYVFYIPVNYWLQDQLKTNAYMIWQKVTTLKRGS